MFFSICDQKYADHQLEKVTKEMFSSLILREIQLTLMFDSLHSSLPFLAQQPERSPSTPAQESSIGNEVMSKRA